MKLRAFSVERYKGYAELAEVELAPLTILVGSNNSGKTALAQAIQLLAGGLAPPEKKNSEPLPLASGGIRHGETFVDLLTGRTVHGRLSLSARFARNGGDLSLSATVQNVVVPSGASVRQIIKWSISSGSNRIEVERQGFDEGSPYLVSILGKETSSQQIGWHGLIPNQSEKLPKWVAELADALKTWAGGVRYLQCPRRLRPSPFTLVEDSPRVFGPKGWDAPLALTADDELRGRARAWYRMVFGVEIDVVAHGNYFDLVANSSARFGSVPLVQSGQGLSHVRFFPFSGG